MLPEIKAVVFIPLTRGKVAVIDFEDFEKVRPYKWHASKQKGRWYAHHRFGKRGYLMAMHRLVLSAPSGAYVDHRDGDGLNNQRYNIRVCTNAQNLQALQKKSSRATSKFRGVSRDEKRSRWIARCGKIKSYIGSFQIEEDAARAYNKKARELFGEWASPNFPA